MDQNSQALEGEEQAAAQNDENNPEAGESYSWEASEYIYHEKPASWYLVMWIIAAILAGILAFLQQWLSIAVIVMMAAAIQVHTRRHPRTLQYSIDDDGVTIGQKHLPYNHFKSFSIFKDMAWYSIDLEPAKRFVPRLTLICENDDIDTIERILSSHMPRLDRQLDVVEKASRYLRF